MNPELTALYVGGKDGQAIGYGRMGTYIVKELRARGVTIYDDDGNPDVKTRTSSGEKINAGRSIPPSPTNTIAWFSVPSHMMGSFEGQHRVFVTMWEASELPESFRETFHAIDTIIVPSIQNQELFSEFHPDVHFMPLGVDPILWNYSPPPPVNNEFRFLINGRGKRKGVDLAFRAFRTVFRGSHNFSPRPRLLMKSLRGHGEYYASDVEHHTGRISPIAEVALYQSCHAYVQPSRGEGFGLAPLQALACGRPTILTDAHGHESYAHLGIGLSAELIPAEYFIYGQAGEWWEPSFDELCESMWDVYKNYDVHADKAKESARVIADGWTWSDTTDRFLEITGAEMSKPYTGSHVWVPAPRQLFRVVTIRDFATEIAGRTLFFAKGQEYWEVADVKRILFDGALLDPICYEEPDHGLAVEQVDQMGLMRAEASYCPTCHQKLNSIPTRADEIYEELLSERGIHA